VHIDAALRHEGFEARDGVAEGAALALDDVFEALLPVALEEGRPFERPELGPYAHLLEVVEHRFGEVRVRAIPVVFAVVEALGTCCLGWKSPSLDRIIGRGRRLPVVFEDVGNDAAGELGLAERQRLVDGLAVDGKVRRAPYPLVVPWRARVPLVSEVEPEGALADDWLEGEPFGAR